jgi:hypothetical protein
MTTTHITDRASGSRYQIFSPSFDSLDEVVDTATFGKVEMTKSLDPPPIFAPTSSSNVPRMEPEDKQITESLFSRKTSKKIFQLIRRPRPVV